MALKLHFACLSFGASVDQQTGHLSVFDLVEEIRVPQVPMTIGSFVIALSLENRDATPFRGKVFIHFLTPDGKQQAIGSGEMDVPAEQRRVRAVFRFGSFPIQMFGSHRFVLSWLDSNGAKVGEALLDFDVIQAQQVAQGVASPDKPNPTMAH